MSQSASSFALVVPAATPVRAALMVCAACTAVGAATLALASIAVPGSHMLLHVVLMSLVAPLGVATWRRFRRHRWQLRPLHVWLATFLQLAVFLYWHSPSGMMLAMHTTDGTFLLQGSLLASACLFWWCVAGLSQPYIWHAIAALLCTGKLFCLVAVILTFAPRSLYHAMTLPDQQLAGLIMITLCPLTYVASALLLCRRWLLAVALRPALTHRKALCA